MQAERRKWNQGQGEMEIKEEEESRERESLRNNWIRQRGSAAGRVFDKWAVYLAFTVNEVLRDDVLPSSSPPPALCLRVPALL